MCEASGAPHGSRPPRRPPTRLSARLLTCCDHRRAWRVPGESARSTRSDSAHTSDTVLTCALRSTPCRIRRSVQDSPKGVSTTWPQRRLRVASVAVRGVRGKLRAPGAERRWQRLQSRQRLQPVACVSQAIMALEGVRAPNVGPNVGPTPAIGHHGPLACDRAAATSTLAGDAQTDPADLGVKSHEFLSSPPPSR